MFAETKIFLEKALKGKYAVGQFNINNLELVQGIVAAAVNLKAPVILATSEGALKYGGIKYLTAIAKVAATENKIPIALHLDHGRDLTVIKQALKLGYSSVMIDASHEEFEKNVKITEQVAQLAHKKNISVEAELGTIGGAEDNIRERKILYTSPEEAKEFVERTGCDFLAVAIGTSHGAYKFTGQPKLNLSLLEEIKQKTKIPLVLHGASVIPSWLIKESVKYGAVLKGVKGVPGDQLRLAVKRGISKVNTDTDLRLAFMAGVRKIIKTQPQEFDPRKMLGPARELVQRVVEERIKLLGSVNKK